MGDLSSKYNHQSTEKLSNQIKITSTSSLNESITKAVSTLLHKGPSLPFRHAAAVRIRPVLGVLEKRPWQTRQKAAQHLPWSWTAQGVGAAEVTKGPKRPKVLILCLKPQKIDGFCYGKSWNIPLKLMMTGCTPFQETHRCLMLCWSMSLLVLRLEKIPMFYQQQCSCLLAIPPSHFKHQSRNHGLVGNDRYFWDHTRPRFLFSYWRDGIWTLCGIETCCYFEVWKMMHFFLPREVCLSQQQHYLHAGHFQTPCQIL